MRPPIPTKLTDVVADQLEHLVGIGCTIEVACAAVGINRQSFYNWQRASEEWRALGDTYPALPVPPEVVPILTFSTRIIRAQARAHAYAVNAVHTGITGASTVEMEPYLHVETRLRMGKDGEEIPYRHEETRFRAVEHVTPPDWRAGIEFLRRRDPAAWNPPQKVEVSFEEQAVAYIRAGEVEFGDMEEEFGYDLAATLFARAGKVVPTRTTQDAGAAADTSGAGSQ